jgi:transcriptional regulator with XRE-family HTH domain
MQRFSEWLASRLLELGWSKGDLSRASGIADGVISRWSTDSTRRPSPASLARIAPALGIPYEDLMRLCGYLPGTPAVQTELRTRMARLEATLSKYPRTWWVAVIDACERMAEAGTSLQPPVSVSEAAPVSAAKALPTGTATEGKSAPESPLLVCQHLLRALFGVLTTCQLDPLTGASTGL